MILTYNRELPPTMNKYERSKLYKIMFSNGDFYVGSTRQPLKDRLSAHKGRPKGNMIDAFRNNDSWKIILVEKYPCADKEELLKREQYWIDELKPTLNMGTAYSSPERKERNKTNRHGYCHLCEVKYKSGRKTHVVSNKHYLMNNFARFNSK